MQNIMIEQIKYFWIIHKLNQLGQAVMVFPIEIFSLSRKIADLKYNENAYRLIHRYRNHSNFHVRRAILTAIRYMGEETIKRYIDVLLESTNDPEGWVVYDAAWALGEFKIKDERVIATLQNVAKDLAGKSPDELEEFNPTESTDYAKKRAAQSLFVYKINYSILCLTHHSSGMPNGAP